MKRVPPNELQNRLNRFRAQMDQTDPCWEMGIILGKVNLYYFTGTMQDGMLLIPREEEATFWVRRSYERAMEESLFPRIKPMRSFRDAAATWDKFPATVYLETEIVPLALYQLLKKYFPIDQVRSLDAQVNAVRAVKSPYELDIMTRAGQIHQRVLEKQVPGLLREGISEAELATELYTLLMQEGHHGVTRFGMFETEVLMGHICFGESSLYPTYFTGPGGNVGLSPAVPLMGSRERRLRKGDLVFIDIGCGVDGYHTDKTMTYMFGQALPPEVRDLHQRCVDIQNQVAAQLKPGAIPAEIYNNTLANLSPDFLENFMGYAKGQVKFLGHGIGLLIDEWPVIAKGFNEPLIEGMTLALEPKKGIAGIGMVGTENTFVVTTEGGRCLTGNHPGLIPVY